ncbi:MAG: hypothetical protein AAGG57_09330 [Pseudomonadota bacterium]
MSDRFDSSERQNMQISFWFFLTYLRSDRLLVAIAFWLFLGAAWLIHPDGLVTLRRGFVAEVVLLFGPSGYLVWEWIVFRDQTRDARKALDK